MGKSESSNNSYYLVGLLGIVFVTLKLCHVIDWSWWFVTLPFYGGFAFIVIIIVFILIIAKMLEK